MPRGLKDTSSLITIGFSLSETGPNTFSQGQTDLQLNPLDNEVFVVVAIDIDPELPDAITATNTQVNCSVSTTTLTAVGNLANTNVLATAQNGIRAAGFVDGGVAFSKGSMETPPAALDYIGIIATNDFFVQVVGSNNLGAKGVSGKMYGYRARASDPSVYAALVQSELLSS